MYQPQPNKHNVGVDEHAAHSAASSSPHHSATASTGDQSPTFSRSRPLRPVSSTGPPHEAETPDQDSPTISEPGTCVESPLPQQTPLFGSQQATTQAPMNDPCALILQYMVDGGEESVECFRGAVEQPPITLESLAELNLPRIANNPKLRHDCNFDRDLHFRPNLDGPKGKQKMKVAEDYWKALEAELFVYGIIHQQRRDPQQADSYDYWHSLLVSSQRRLPQLFNTIRDILESLVPNSDQKAILERLDVELIMQEIMNGVCDLIDLGNWLAKVLKHNCAPMRDPMVDAMHWEIKRGASEEKPGRLVNGIRQVLNILEMMKLDIANHQIRHMRPMLVEDTVNFQQKYNAHRIKLGKVDVATAREWLQEEMEVPLADGRTLTHLEALGAGTLKLLVFYEHVTGYPPTFYLDVDRLRAVRLDLQTTAYHLVCRDVLVAVTGHIAAKDHLAQAIEALHGTVAAIVGVHGRFQERLKNIAAEIMRIVLLLEQRSPLFDPTLLDFIEQQLEVDLHTGSPAFEKHAQDLYDRILPKLQISLEVHARFKAIHLQDKFLPAATHQPQNQTLGFGAVLAPTVVVPQLDPDQDIVNRFTHLLVLHWQVWRDLVYLAAPEVLQDTTTTQPQSPAPASPTMPVAQATYAPGHSILSDSVRTTDMPSSSASATHDVHMVTEQEAHEEGSPQHSRQAKGEGKQPAS